MFENFLCYWLLWLLFIMITFFMKHNMKRYWLGCWLLIIIGLSNHYFALEGIQVSFALVAVLFGTVIYFVESSYSILKLFQAFTVMISYTALLIWAKMEPVWFFIPVYIFVPCLIVLLVLVIKCETMEATISLVLFGMTLGQILFDFLLYTYHLGTVIGDVGYLIHVSITVLILVFFQAVVHSVEKMSNVIQRKIV